MTTHQCAAGCGRPSQTTLCQVDTRLLTDRLMSIATGNREPLASWTGHHVREHVGHAYDPATRTRVEVRTATRLGTLPGLWEELQATIARTDRHGTGTGGRRGEAAVPYHERASAAAHQLHNTLTTWARDILDIHQHLTLSATSAPDVARWLAALPTLLAEHPAAGELHRDVLAAVRDAEHVIDRAPDRVYVGPCRAPSDDHGPCPGQLYAHRDDEQPVTGVVRCRVCGTQHDAAERRQWLSGLLAEQLLPAAIIAPVVSYVVDKRIRVETLVNWRSKGRVTRHVDPRTGEPRYQFGEVEELAREMRPRNTGPRVKVAPGHDTP